jgi:ribosomal protein S18 acetylase RimI-like enzyme
VRLHAIVPAEVEEAANVLFSAFLDDPFFDYLFGPKRNAGEMVKTIHTFTLRYGIRYGEVFSPSERIEGVAIWLPPGTTTMTAWRALRSGALQLRAAARIGLRGSLSFMERMRAYSDFAERLHKKHAPFRHWYLVSLGVKPECRGKGYASELLRPRLERCDVEGLPCYLETHNERNLDLYRHFGFQVKEQGVLPGSDRYHWVMLREPGERAEQAVGSLSGRVARGGARPEEKGEVGRTRLRW